MLADQIDRSVGSIPANISEGCGKDTKLDFKRFLNHAVSSSTELENHLIKALKLKLIAQEEHDSLVADVVEVRKIIHGLKKSL